MIEADKLMEIMEKERETKEDGRYIIFYTFEDEED